MIEKHLFLFTYGIDYWRRALRCANMLIRGQSNEWIGSLIVDSIYSFPNNRKVNHLAYILWLAKVGLLFPYLKLWPILIKFFSILTHLYYRWQSIVINSNVWPYCAGKYRFPVAKRIHHGTKKSSLPLSRHAIHPHRLRQNRLFQCILWVLFDEQLYALPVWAFRHPNRWTLSAQGHRAAFQGENCAENELVVPYNWWFNLIGLKMQFLLNNSDMHYPVNDPIKKGLDSTIPFCTAIKNTNPKSNASEDHSDSDQWKEV